MSLLDSPWPLRIAWLGLPVVAGPSLVDALGDASAPVQVVAGALLWLVWGAGVVAVLVPRSAGLTVLRVAAPAVLAASVWALLASPGAASAAGVGWSALGAALVLFVPSVADAFVDGSSYGSERRFCLRAPVALLLGPVELAWIAVVGGLAAGPLLLAARQWVLGGLLVAAGAGVVPIGWRSLHQLARRWIVFVPAGVVLHDPIALLDPVLFPKPRIAAIGPAAADAAGSATDITSGALGLVLELRLRSTATVPVRSRGRRHGEPVETTWLLIAAARPGALMAEARQRALPVRTPPSPT